MNCNICKHDKPETEFSKCKYYTRGYQYYCKECGRESHKNWRRTYKESITAKKKKEYKKNKILIRHRAWFKDFGLTPDDYDKMLETQDHRCKICKDHVTSLPKILSVDHCHATGRIRGLLCINCNLLLGHAKDSEERLKSAIEYLNNTKDARYWL